jgi:hypothetical protein
MSCRRWFYVVFLLALFTTVVTATGYGQAGIVLDGGCDPCDPAPPPPPPDLTFNVFYYEAIHPDVQNVYGNNTTAATNHYYLFGLPAGWRGGIIFDPVYYLQIYPDLAQIFGPTGYQAAAQHFINQGLPNEGRRGSLEFDVQYYLANNPDLLATFGSTGYIAAAQHFLSTGLIREGRRGSADVDIKAYINNYPDVAIAYGGTAMGRYIDPMLHWLRRGKQFGRQATGALVTTTDCIASTPPAGYTRVYIGIRTDDLDGSGNTAADPRNGNLFDSILRSYTHDPAGGVPAADHMIFCLGPGTYLTDGSYNWVIGIPQNSETIQNKGFVLGPYWHIHGAGMNQTTVQLNSYYVPPPGGEPASLQGGLNTGTNVVFATSSDNNPGDEISDLTIDDNYPGLHAQAGTQPLRLEAIHLRDNVGRHYIHRVNVINAASEDPQGEAFPVEIVSVAYSSNHAGRPAPAAQANTLGCVTMSQWHGHLCTAISLVYATGAIQYNVVDGYQFAYGGWEMPLVLGSGATPNKFVYIHDNVAFNNQYGFNIDSEYNDAVNIQFNWIVNPSNYGIVIGGGPLSRFDGFWFLYNKIEGSGVALTGGILFQGNVTNAVVTRTNFVSDGGESGPAFLATIKNSVTHTNNPFNIGNVYQYNQIDSAFSFDLGGALVSCIFGNWDQNGTQRSGFADTQATPCRPGL